MNPVKPRMGQEPVRQCTHGVQRLDTIAGGVLSLVRPGHLNIVRYPAKTIFAQLITYGAALDEHFMLLVLVSGGLGLVLAYRIPQQRHDNASRMLRQRPQNAPPHFELDPKLWYHMGTKQRGTTLITATTQLRSRYVADSQSALFVRCLSD